MIFTEDHAPLFTGMISDWKLAQSRDGSVKIEYIIWNKDINTRDKHHYVETSNPADAIFRTYWHCARFTIGDYICRNPTIPSRVWICSPTSFEQFYSKI